MKRTVIKNFGLCLCLFISFAFAACSLNGNLKTNYKLKVSIVDSVFFTLDSSCAETDYGGNALFVLKMRSGYEFASCDYPDYEVTEENGKYALTLKNVIRPSRVTVYSSEIQREDLNTNPQSNCTIDYVLNDGTNARKSVNYSYSYHIRPNTLGGEGIEREGYTLLGWNTKADGSGEHIGLGSRATVADGQTLTLYGEWVSWIDENEFLTKRLSDGTVQITGYRGSGDIQPFVIPAQIDGLPVTAIASSFTANMRCGTLSSNTLILPSTLKEVEDNAFLNSSFTEIYFFDSLEFFGTYAFPYALSTYRLNANTSPRLQKYNYNVRFADNLDRIIVNRDKKKLIFFSGCSLCYGLNSGVVDDAFNGEYVIVNAGLNGEFNALFQMECMLPYINKGDIFVHAPEQANPYQFLESKMVDSRVYCMVEGNYDLLALSDFSYNNRMTEAYTSYINLRSEQEECDYSDYTDMFNNYGDYYEKRPYDESTEAARDISYTENWGFRLSLLKEQNISALAEIYSRFRDSGADVYFSWAPINEQSDGNENIYEAANDFQSLLTQKFALYGFKIISEVKSYIYKGRYFFDTDYHLNNLGVALRTEQLIKDLKAASV